MILKFDFRKKKSPLGPLFFLALIVIISSLVVAQRSDLVKLSKFLKTSKPRIAGESKRQRLEAQKEATTPLEKPSVEKQLVLSGVLIVGDERFAYLRTFDGEKYILREGEYGGKFTLERVFPDSVILLWNDGRREVIKW
jgi:hypothetical protein